MADNDGDFGAAISPDGKYLGVFVDDDVTLLYECGEEVPLSVWNEILTRHFDASCDLPEEQVDGWMSGALDEVQRKFGGRPIQATTVESAETIKVTPMPGGEINE